MGSGLRILGCRVLRVWGFHLKLRLKDLNWVFGPEY